MPLDRLWAADKAVTAHCFAPRLKRRRTAPLVSKFCSAKFTVGTTQKVISDKAGIAPAAR